MSGATVFAAVPGANIFAAIPGGTVFAAVLERSNCINRCSGSCCKLAVVPEAAVSLLLFLKQLL